MTTAAAPVRITLPKAKKALREVSKKFPSRTNPANQLVVRTDTSDVFQPITDTPEENLEPGCLIGVILAEHFGVPLTTLAQRSGHTVAGMGDLPGVEFTPDALSYLEIAQRAADGRGQFVDNRAWGEIPALLKAAA